MSSLPPPRDTDQDWLDDAILAAILALQFGNTSALQLQRIMIEARQEIEGILRTYRGGSPSRIINRIKGVVARLAKRLEKRTDDAVKVLVAMEAANLGARQKDLRDPMIHAAIGGRTSKALIKRYIVDYLMSDLVARIRELTRMGEDGEGLVVGTRKVLDGAERSARTVGISRANAAVSEGRRRYAAANGFKLMWVSVLDSRTTIQCANLDGEVWDAKEPHALPPIHPNCRSAVVVVTGPAPKVRKGFKEWLGDQSELVQNTVLGTARAEAWRSGALTLSQMVDATRTRPLSLKRLKELGRL